MIWESEAGELIRVVVSSEVSGGWGGDLGGEASELSDIFVVIQWE